MQKMAKRNELLLKIALISAMLPKAGFPQQQCGEGIVLLPLNVNGKVSVCLEVASQVPELSRQMSQILQTQKDQKTQIQVIGRFVKSLNDVSQGIGTQRQIEFARNLALRLGASQRAGADVTQTRIADLTGGFEDLKDQLFKMLSNRATADKTNSAVDGPVGDAIARLDLTTARDLLEDIRAQLQALHSEVAAVDKRTKDIQETLEKQGVDLSRRIDCSSATPEALSAAIKGRATERVMLIWHCRPENTALPQVQTPYVLLFTKEEFGTAEPFLNQLVTAGFNPLKEIKPLPGPMGDPRNETSWLATKYFYAPVYRPLIEGNNRALKWLIANAPPGYWSGYPTLLEDLTRIMQLPWGRISGETAAETITLLRNAGVPDGSGNHKAFREAYEKWLEAGLPQELRKPLDSPDQIQRSMARQMGYSLVVRPPQPGERDLWKAVSDALAPASADVARRSRNEAVTEMTEADLKKTDLIIKQMSDRLSQSNWWRKLPETRGNLDEAVRRQALNVFDTFGYVPVAQGDLRDEDVSVNQSYPNCNCSTAKDLRDRLAKASHRRDSILQFRAEYAK